MKKKVIIIAGPTAVGKTAAAIRVAQHYKTEIISVDSRQCFRELNIGVARPSTTELELVSHHFIASHSIHDEVSAAVFEEEAMAITDNVFRNNDNLVVVGGTGLYIKAFMQGLDPIPEVKASVRATIHKKYIADGIEWLRSEVMQRDPLYASTGSLENPQRMMRALEVVMATGKSIIQFRQSSKKERSFDMVVVQLDLPREELYHRINLRVDQMVEQGLLKEAEALYPYRHLNALQTVGYTELFDYMDGNISLEASIEKIKQHTRNFAKRQITWFRHQLHATTFHPEDISGMLGYFMKQSI
jgi:tRNA dimethylallyltransferase